MAHSMGGVGDPIAEPGLVGGLDPGLEVDIPMGPGIPPPIPIPPIIPKIDNFLIRYYPSFFIVFGLKMAFDSFKPFH